MEIKSILDAGNEPEIDGRKVTGFAAVMGNVDDGGDRIFTGAFKKTIKEGSSRIRHLWQHDISSPPVAAIRELSEVHPEDMPEKLVKAYPEITGALKVVREYLNTPRGEEILAGIKTGAIKEMSIGYDPIKFDFEQMGDEGMMVRNLRQIRLWDTSDVNFGMNPLTMSSSKKALPYKDTGKADEGTSWSAPSLGDFSSATFEDMSAADRQRIASHYAFSVNWPPESFGDLKLPHHQASTSGVGKAVWRGVAAAMGALLGARGGVDIPSSDRKAVYNHLSKHYSDFEKEPPDYKLVELSGIVSVLLLPDALKEGRVLSKRNLEKLAAALQTLNDILLSAAPSDDEKTLTEVEEIMGMLAKAELDLKLYTI